MFGDDAFTYALIHLSVYFFLLFFVDTFGGILYILYA